MFLLRTGKTGYAVAPKARRRLQNHTPLPRRLTLAPHCLPSQFQQQPNIKLIQSTPASGRRRNVAGRLYCHRRRARPLPAQWPPLCSFRASRHGLDTVPARAGPALTARSTKLLPPQPLPPPAARANATASPGSDLSHSHDRGPLSNLRRGKRPRPPRRTSLESRIPRPPGRTPRP